MFVSRLSGRRRPFAFALAAVLAAASVASVAAGLGDAGEPTAVRAARHGSAPIDQIIEQVERRYRAHVVRVGQEEVDGRRIYVLRLLSDQGRVWTIRVDESGREF